MPPSGVSRTSCSGCQSCSRTQRARKGLKRKVTGMEAGALEDAEGAFELKRPLFARPHVEGPGQGFQTVDSGKIELAPVIAQAAVGDKDPGGHIVLQMVGFDDTPRVSARPRRVVSDLDRAALDKRFGHRPEDLVRRGTKSMPGGGKGFFQAGLVHSKGGGGVLELSAEAAKRLADKSSGAMGEQAARDQHSQYLLLGGGQAGKIETLLGVIVAPARVVIVYGRPHPVAQEDDIALGGLVGYFKSFSKMGCVGKPLLLQTAVEPEESLDLW